MIADRVGGKACNLLLFGFQGKYLAQQWVIFVPLPHQAEVMARHT